MSKIGNLTGRSMANVASAIGQSLAGNNALAMHNNRQYKDQVGAPHNLRQWEEYDPNPYIPSRIKNHFFIQYEIIPYIDHYYVHIECMCQYGVGLAVGIHIRISINNSEYHNVIVMEMGTVRCNIDLPEKYNDYPSIDYYNIMDLQPLHDSTYDNIIG